MNEFRLRVASAVEYVGYWLANLIRPAIECAQCYRCGLLTDDMDEMGICWEEPGDADWVCPACAVELRMESNAILSRPFEGWEDIISKDPFMPKPEAD